MYSIYSTVAGVTVCLHEDTVADPRVKTIDPVLTLEESAAGSLSFKLAPNNAGYSEYTVTEYESTGENASTYEYNVTENEPANWVTDYPSYFTKNGNVYEEVPKSVSGAPTWAANTYYERTAVDTTVAVQRQVDLVERMAATITVFEENQNGTKTEIWEGRVLSESREFNNLRTIYCEGAMAYLNDTIQPQRQYSLVTIRQFMEAVLNIHNGKVSANRQFQIGIVTVDVGDITDRKTDYGSTWEAISKLLEDYGGRLVIRKNNGIRYLDYLANYSTISTQTIMLGKNLVDFTRSWDMSNLCTAVLPTGKVLESATTSSVGEPVTTALTSGGPYLASTQEYSILYLDKGENKSAELKNTVKVRKSDIRTYRIKTYKNLPADANFYVSSRLHNGYVAYAIYTSSGVQHSYKTSGSENTNGLVDLVDSKVTMPHSELAGATYILKVCSWGDDIPPVLKYEVPPTTDFDKHLTVVGYATKEEYTVTLEEPYNWPNVYTEYYRKSGSTYVQVTDVNPPVWTENTFYQKNTWHTSDSPYVLNQPSITKYGWIEKHIEYSEAETQEELYNQAKAYLQSGQFDEMTIDLTAFDLSCLNLTEAQIDAIHLGDMVEVISEPHGMDRLFPVTKLEIPLNKPADRQYTLGYSSGEPTLSKSNSDTLSTIDGKIAAIPSMSSILTSAQNNAAQLINDSNTPSYVTFVKEPSDSSKIKEILICNNIDPERATDMWRWNVNGLGFRHRDNITDPWSESDYTTAITMDGKIVANFVATGTMFADRIHGGILTLGGYDNKNGVAYVKDANGNNICILDNTGAFIKGIILNIGADAISHNPDTFKYSRMTNGMMICGTTANDTETERGRVNGGIAVTDTTVTPNKTYYGVSLEANRHGTDPNATVSGGAISLCAESIWVSDSNPLYPTMTISKKLSADKQSGGIEIVTPGGSKYRLGFINGLLVDCEQIVDPPQNE